MDQNLENKQEQKNKLINFYNLHKVKIYIFIFFLILTIILSIFFKYNSERKNILISEKYIQAGIYLSSNKEKNAKELYEEIIYSNNKFYSILALNTIIEKNLIEEDEQVLNYFKNLENLDYTEERQDLIAFKKALYLLKVKKKKEGKKILENLIKKGSQLKNLAEELLNN